MEMTGLQCSSCGGRPLLCSGCAKLKCCQCICANTALRGRLHEIAVALGKVRKLRVYVAAAPGMGHHGTTINLMLRLIELGFRGKVQLIYEDRSDCGPQASKQVEKLLRLLPELEPRTGFFSTEPLAGIKLDSGVEVSPIAMSRFLKTSPKPYPLGFTGGFDSDTVKIDLRAELKVGALIQLQPAGWTQGKRLFADGGVPLSLEDGLKERAFVFPNTGDPAFGSTAKLQAARALCVYAGEGTIDLWPVYGIEPQNSRLQVPTLETITADGILSLFLEAAHRLSESRRQSTGRSRGIAIVVLSENQDGVKAKLGLGLAARNDARMRITELGSDFDARVREADSINLVMLSGVPVRVFSRLLELATLPPAFEGMGTLGLARSIGKPFLHFENTVTYNVTLAKFGAAQAKEIWEAVSAVGQLFMCPIDKWGQLPQGYRSTLEKFVQFITDATDPGSKTYQLFKRASDELRVNDGLVWVLETLIEKGRLPR